MSSSSPSSPTEKKSINLKHLINRVIAFGVSFVVLACILGVFWLFHLDRFVEQLELKSYDLRAQTQWNNEHDRPSSDVVILQFDDTSLNALSDEFGLWPWPRNVHARMIDYLNHLGTRALLYDIMFVSHRKGNDSEDKALVDSFRKYSNVYLSMNLDHELEQNKKLGKDLTPQDIERIRPISIRVKSELDQAPKNTILHLKKDADGTVFFDNSNMTFDHYRSIMTSLLEKGSNIGIINHGTDEDGVSRSNPLFFRFLYQPFIKTTALPLHAETADHFFDAKGQRTDKDGYLLQKTNYLPVIRKENPNVKGSSIYFDSNPENPQVVDADGYLMDGYGHYVYMREHKNQALFFPYLGLRAMLDLSYPNQTPKMTITANGHLKFANMDIPLRPDGSCLITWYNVNLIREALEKEQLRFEKYTNTLKGSIQRLEAALSLKPSPDLAQKLEAQIKSQQTDLQHMQSVSTNLDQVLKAPFVPQPYEMVSAWKVVRAMLRYEKGLPPSPEDKVLEKFLKNKIIFLGATAVAAYDIKNTPIAASMPGVILQANLFDNVFQNANSPNHKQNAYIERVPPYVNVIITVILCALALTANLRIRSTIIALLSTANLVIIYVLATIVVYHNWNLWIDVAMPLVSIIITTLLSFITKYIMRNRDYEKTYALATTDSMTGLYNHRFFQESIRNSIDQSNRYGHPFALLLIDIDFFKKFNDTYGHQAGDNVLKHVAAQLKKTVRSIDIVCRYGGEEMAILVARAGQDEALQVADKVVKSIASEAYPIADGVSKHVTISIGVAVYPQHGSTAPQLIETADGGLYRAKENGRNQVGSIPEHAGEEEKAEAERKKAEKLAAQQAAATNNDPPPAH